ncbi:hypothetical protein [Thiohalorhabdus methylotrophus]|uniref:Uncharacterized protein n=1 Tax=Thiohalorhabdus methylotrophus TaxID=3242694 RepID=A0ABV4TY12_9GAMM
MALRSYPKADLRRQDGRTLPLPAALDTACRSPGLDPGAEPIGGPRRGAKTLGLANVVLR